MLVDLHHADPGSRLYPDGPLSPVGHGPHAAPRCGALNVAAVQPVLAARWAAGVVSSQAHEVAVGECSASRWSRCGRERPQSRG